MIELLAAVVTCVALLAITYRMELPFAILRSTKRSRTRTFTEKEWAVVYAALRIPLKSRKTFRARTFSKVGNSNIEALLLSLPIAGAILLVGLPGLNVGLLGSSFSISPYIIGAVAGAVVFLGSLLFLGRPHLAWKMRLENAEGSYERWQQ
jgi:hypothetical protein